MLEKTNIVQWFNSWFYGLNPLRFKGIQAAYLFLFSLFFLPISAFAEDLKGTPAVTTIWVVGDKDLVADAFSACAMLFGNGGIMGALFLSSVIAIGTMACATIIHRSMNVFNYIVIFVVIMALFTVKTTVYIASYYDLDPKTGQVKGGVIGAVPHKEIANVPVGVALPLGIMSNFGKAITDKFDTALNSPNSEAGFLIQGSEGYFSPLKTILRLRNQWNTPENQYLMDNIRVVMDKETGCGWNQGNGAELLGKQGLRGLLANSTPSGIDKPIKIPEIDPITGNVLSVGTYTVDCPLAGLIINAQMLQNVSALQGKNYSQLAESIAKKRNLALTASGTKDSSDYTKRVAATQQEIDKVPNLVIKSLTGSYSGSTNVAITIQDTSQFLNQVRKMAETQNGTAKQAVSYQNAKNKGIIPSTMIIGNAITIDHINAAEIQANMIYGNLLLNCLSNDVTCARAETLMTDARSKAAVDSAGQASMYAHYMHYGMNILIFIYVVMSPLMIIVIMAMGVHGWKLIKSYLLFAVWINSWLPASIAIAYYQLRSYETSVANLVKSLIHEPAMIYSPVVVNNILSGAADSIASASNFMASVPLLMMALLSGSVYGLTHLAQKAAMSHKDYVDEGAVVQSPNDAQSYNAQIAQMMMRNTGGNATSANAEHLVLGTRQGNHVDFALSSNMNDVESAKSTISSNISALGSISNTQTWGEVDSQSKTIQDGGIHISQTSDGQQQVSFGSDAAHALASGQGFSLGVSGEKVVAVGANGQISENVQVKHANGESEVLTSKMSLQTGDSIVTDFGTVSSSAITSSAQEVLSHQESQLAAIETAQSHSTSGGISVNFDNELYNHAVSAPNAMDIKHNALSKAGEYSTDFEQQIMRAGNYASELQITKDALNSNDMNKVQAASEYLSTIFTESGIDGGESIAEQIKGYAATRTGNFEEQVRQEINSDISARNAADRFSFADNSVSQQGEMVRSRIESGQTATGFDAGERINAEKNGGNTIEQRKTMHEENIAAMKAEGDRLMNALEDYSQRNPAVKFGDWEFQAARQAWEATKDNWDMGNYGAAAVGAGLTGVSYALAPVVQLASDVLNGSDSSQNNLGVHSVGNPELQKILDEAVASDEKIRNYMENPQDLDSKPFNDAVAEKVGAPKYAPADTVNTTDSGQSEQSFVDKAKEVVGEVVADAAQTFLGVTPAHADTMPLSHIQENTATNQHDSDIAKTGYHEQGENNHRPSEQNEDTQNQADKNSSGSLNGATAQATEQLLSQAAPFVKQEAIHATQQDDMAINSTTTPQTDAWQYRQQEQYQSNTPSENKAENSLSGRAEQSQTESVGDKYPQFDKLLGRHEGGYDDFNAKNGSKYTAHRGEEIADGKKLSDLTVGEVMQMQKNGELFAAGHYQITPLAMKDAVRLAGVSPDEQFSPEIQDKLFEDGLLKKAGAGKLHDYITGKSDDIDKAMLATAQEWAAFPVPHDMHVSDKFGERDLKAGDSYYEGVKGNHSNMSLEDAKAAIEEMRTNYLAAHSADNQTAENAQSETPAETSPRLEAPQQQAETQTEATQSEKTAIEHAKEIVGSALGVGAASAVDEKSDDKPQTDNLAEQQRTKEAEKQAEREWRIEARHIREERLKQNTDGKTPLSKEDFDYNINLSSERNAMKSKLESRLAELNKGGIQADEKEETAQIKSILKDIKQHEKASEAQVSLWTKVGSSLPSLPDWSVNFAAGMGDFVSFGLTEKVREVADIDGGVDTNSTAYKGGEVAGVAVGVVATGGSAAVRAGVAKAAANPVVKSVASGTVNAVSMVGKISAGFTGLGLYADITMRTAMREFNQDIKYDEKMCNALYTIDEHANNAWVSGNKPLYWDDIGKEHDFLDNIAKVPREVNGVDLAYFLMENRFARSAGKTGLGLGKVTQIPVGIMGAAGLDIYSATLGVKGNPKGIKISELRTDLKGTLMGFEASSYKDIKSFADAKCHKP